MSKFTPGPWGLGEKAGPRDITLKRRHWQVGQNRGKGVAIAFGDDEANARLIAAAPDLLEACKTAAEFLTSYKPRSLSLALQALQAAIRKAEGVE